MAGGARTFGAPASLAMPLFSACTRSTTFAPAVGGSTAGAGFAHARLEGGKIDGTIILYITIKMPETSSKVGEIAGLKANRRQFIAGTSAAFLLGLRKPARAESVLNRLDMAGTWRCRNS